MFPVRLVFDGVSFLFFVDIWMIEVGLFFGWIAGLLEHWGRGVAHCLGKEEGKQFSLGDYFTNRYQILFGASINSQSIDTKSVAFWLQPHLQFWHLQGLISITVIQITIIRFFNHPERRASFVFVLYRFLSMSLMKDPVGGGFVWMPHSCSLFSDRQ